jgi:hypothetical protein
MKQNRKSRRKQQKASRNLTLEQKLQVENNRLREFTLQQANMLGRCVVAISALQHKGIFNEEDIKAEYARLQDVEVSDKFDGITEFAKTSAAESEDSPDVQDNSGSGEPGLLRESGDSALEGSGEPTGHSSV